MNDIDLTPIPFPLRFGAGGVKKYLKNKLSKEACYEDIRNHCCSADSRYQHCLIRVSAEAAEKRLALVIGNSDYKVKPYKPLANPVNDAKDMEDMLRRLDFEVISKFNADQKDMEDAITDFGKHHTHIRRHNAAKKESKYKILNYF